MPLELVYFWAVTLLMIVGLLYLWMRLRVRRQQGEPSWLGEDWFARLVYALSEFVKRPSSGTISPLPTSSVIDPSAASAGETPVHWSAPVSPGGLRFPVTVLLAAGVLLVWMGQTIYATVPEPERGYVLLLMLLGGVTFLLAGRMAHQQWVPSWLVPGVRRVSAYFEIQAGQLVLLLMAPFFVWMAILAAGESFLARHWWVATSAWVLAIGAAAVGSLRLEKVRGLRLSRAEIAFTAGLLLFAFLLRGVATDVIPTTFSGDEGSAGISALTFIEGKANNLFATGWFSFPSFYFAVVSLSIRLLGQTIEALRISSAAAGALAVVFTYWLARSMFDRKTAVLAGLYLMASHYHIHMSRIGLNNIWDSLFGTAAILGFWHGWKTGKRPWYVLCGVAVGFGQYFYVSIRVLPILFLLWSGVALFRDRDRFRQRLPGMMLAAFIALLVVLPLGLFFVNHPHEFNAPLARVTIMGDWLQHEMQLRGESAAAILTDQAILAMLGFTRMPLRLLYDPGAPLLLTGAATLFLLGIAWAVSHFDLRYLLLFLPLVGAIASSTVSQSPPASQRYVMAVPLVAIFVALPLGLAGNWMDRLWSRRKYVGLVLTAVVMLAVVAQDLKYYFFDVYDNYILGGINTLVATEIADYLETQAPDEQDVYFFGFPRMGYFSLSTIPYLVPQKRGIDVLEPLESPPKWELNGPTLFVFLPERVFELEQVRRVYGDGRYREFYDEDNLFLFAVYEVP